MCRQDLRAVKSSIIFFMVLVGLLVYFLVGCVEDKSDYKARVRKGRVRPTVSSVSKDKVAELEKRIEELSAKQIKIVEAIDKHSHTLYSLLDDHSEVYFNWLSSTTEKDWVTGVWTKTQNGVFSITN